jgi:hypothetical protein
MSKFDFLLEGKGPFKLSPEEQAYLASLPLVGKTAPPSPE